MMEEVALSTIVSVLESGSREKGGSIQLGVVSIGGGNLNSLGGFSWEKLDYVSETHYNNMSSGKIQKGDILIVKDGATTGKVSYVDELFPFKDAAINEHVFKLQVDLHKVNPKYVFYFLISPRGQLEILKDFRGAAVGGITRGFINRVKIPLPDLMAQNRIVAVLDKIQGLINRNENISTQLDLIIKSVFLQKFGDPVLNEKGWPKSKLHQFGHWKSGGTPARNREEFFRGHIPWITSGELNNIFISNAKEKITDKAIQSSNAKIIQAGSILIGMYDTAALKSSITLTQATCNQAVAYAYIDESICNVVYLYFCLQIGKQHFKSMQRGARQQNMNLSMIRQIEIPVPSLDMQRHFANLVHFTEKLKEKIKYFVDELYQLQENVSYLSFKGELVSNAAIELEAILKDIGPGNISKEDSITAIQTNSGVLQLLLEKLTTNQFDHESHYEKAKNIAFSLLKNEAPVIHQVFDEKYNKIKLSSK